MSAKVISFALSFLLPLLTVRYLMQTEFCTSANYLHSRNRAKRRVLLYKIGRTAALAGVVLFVFNGKEKWFDKLFQTSKSLK